MRARAALVLPTFVLVACSALFEDAEQCKKDADCSQYGAVCSDGICTKATLGEGGIAEGGGPDAPLVIDAPVDSAPLPDPCQAADRPVIELAGEVPTDLVLPCTNQYIMRSRVVVRAGATLTIDPGTVILSDPGTALVIQMGAKIMANGTKDKPIVMTSSSPTPMPGDWMGVYVLGDAAPALSNQYYNDPDLLYGGTNADSNSGSITFMRVEYGIYGLATGGVGRATKIDSVMARLTSDNCFTAFGGTVDFKHLICQFPGDEMFEGNDSWAGRLQFFWGTKSPAGDEHHGVLLDSSTTTINNVTLCGENLGQSYGLVIRNGSRVDLGNFIVTGWFGGVDTRGPIVQPGTDIANSIFFGNAGNPAYVEGSSGDPNSYLFDDDNGFSEVAWFEMPSRVDMEIDPGLVACTDVAAPKPYPPAAIPGRAPAADGFFDSAAAYEGAFADPNDAWATGAWVKFGDK